jgi:NNP family nitrate/nitrite transporter-like MFS transporter
MGQNIDDRYRWYILALAALTNTVTVAIPSMCLSVLFKEISNDLNLNLVQVGIVWGISSLPGVVTVLLGGIIADRFGPKRVLTVSCLLAGLAGALRGTASDFTTLVVAVFFLGFLTPAVSMNTLKTCGLWFSKKELGLASGVISMGMALGFMIGSLVSATILSPMLGGWRNVLILYGVIAMAFSIPWYFSRNRTHGHNESVSTIRPLSVKETMSSAIRIRNVWLLGLAILGVGGCIQGTLGYLPLYLRGQGWTPANADGALATFHLISLICVVPIALLSDRIGSRKNILLAATGLIFFGVGLLSFVQGFSVWIAVLMAGMVRDGFMAVFMTMIIETEGVGPKLAGTATGLVMVFSGISNLIAPPWGNSMAAISPGAPFIFWACLTIFGFIGLFLAKERQVQAPKPSKNPIDT